MLEELSGTFGVGVSQSAGNEGVSGSLGVLCSPVGVGVDADCSAGGDGEVVSDEFLCEEACVGAYVVGVSSCADEGD